MSSNKSVRKELEGEYGQGYNRRWVIWKKNGEILKIIKAYIK